MLEIINELSEFKNNKFDGYGVIYDGENITQGLFKDNELFVVTLALQGFFFGIMKIDIFDTTLRDGFQQEGISPSVKDKLAIAKLLDDLGVDYIEGGWPGASPKEEEFFDKAKKELKLKNAKLVSFGSTRKLNI